MIAGKAKKVFGIIETIANKYPNMPLFLLADERDLRDNADGIEDWSKSKIECVHYFSSQIENEEYLAQLEAIWKRCGEK
jgi:thiamine monophosphate synthase